MIVYPAGTPTLFPNWQRLDLVWVFSVSLGPWQEIVWREERKGRPLTPLASSPWGHFGLAVSLDGRLFLLSEGVSLSRSLLPGSSNCSLPSLGLTAITEQLC